MAASTLDSLLRSRSSLTPAVSMDVQSSRTPLSERRGNCSSGGMEDGMTMNFRSETQEICNEAFGLAQRKGAAVDIRFENISYTVPQGRRKEMKSIVKAISGEFRSGELTAIMGPSGAGKSSMMNILAGLTHSNVTGDILINGEERNLNHFRKMSCYIMQKDELCHQLSVLELMIFAANLKIGTRTSQAERQKLVNDLLETIGLSHVGSTRTIHLSGGQKKRLAIALELINNPPVMFFDEPTSGLDSSSCLQCISLLKSLAQGGRTVICVIHQPSSSIFEMFDHLYLMAEGQCIYRGPTYGVANFISTAINVPFPSYHSQCDFAIDVASGIYGYQIDKLVNQVIKTGNHPRASSIKRESGLMPDFEKGVIEYADGANPISSIKLSLESLAIPDDPINNKDFARKKMKSSKDHSGASNWSQLMLLTNKTLVCILRNKTLTFVRTIIHVVFGILVGLLYINIGNDASKILNNVGLMIYAQLFLVSTAMMLTTMTFPLEMPVLRREQLNNWYNLKMYYLAKTIADIPFQIILTAVFVIPVYFLSDQPLDATRFFMYLSIAIMTSFVAQSVGLAIGAVLPLQAAVFLAPVSAVPLFLFSGFFVTFSTVPTYLRWVCYVVYVRYGYEGSMVSIYGDNRPNLYCSSDYCHFKTPAKILKVMDMEDSLFWVDLVALTAFYIAIRFFTYFLLRWRLKSQE